MKHDVELVPSQLILRAWSAHTSESKSFARFCASVFPSFVTLPRHIDPTKYEATRALYCYVFQGAYDPAIWPKKEEGVDRGRLFDVIGSLLNRGLPLGGKTKLTKHESEMVKGATAGMQGAKVT